MRSCMQAVNCTFGLLLKWETSVTKCLVLLGEILNMMQGWKNEENFFHLMDKLDIRKV